MSHSLDSCIAAKFTRYRACIHVPLQILRGNTLRILEVAVSGHLQNVASSNQENPLPCGDDWNHQIQNLPLVLPSFSFSTKATSPLRITFDCTQKQSLRQYTLHPQKQHPRKETSPNGLTRQTIPCLHALNYPPAALPRFSPTENPLPGPPSCHIITVSATAVIDLRQVLLACHTATVSCRFLG